MLSLGGGSEYIERPVLGGGDGRGQGEVQPQRLLSRHPRGRRGLVAGVEGWRRVSRKERGPGLGRDEEAVEALAQLSRVRVEGSRGGGQRGEAQEVQRGRPRTALGTGFFAEAVG